jgi:hypothetical protein
MKYKSISIDTEFKNTSNKYITTVCAVIKNNENETTHSFWTLDHKGKCEFKQCLDKYLLDGFVIISYMAAAEVRFLQSVGYTNIEILNMKFVDPYILWKMILHCLPEYQYGKYSYTVNNKTIIVHTRPPKEGEFEDGTYYVDGDGNDVRYSNIHTRQYNPSLAHACLRILDIEIDEVHKERMRDVILNNQSYTADQRYLIMEYCKQDTEYLLDLTREMASIIKGYNNDFSISNIIRLSQWVVITGLIENNGIPVDVEKIRSFSSYYSDLIRTIPEQCNATYPFFIYDTLNDRYIKSYAQFEKFIQQCPFKDSWEKTATGRYKSDIETLEKFEAIPEIQGLITAVQALKELSFFSEKRVEKIIKNIGDDNRLRISLFPFSSKTSRCQPRPSHGYLFGMSRWFRTLVSASGKTIIGADYSGQEIAIQAVLSDDASFKQAYLSSDPYTWFARKAEVIPYDVERKGKYYYREDEKLPDSEQTKYTSQRSLFKNILLGVGYGMGTVSLSNRLTASRIESLPDDEKNILRDPTVSTTVKDNILNKIVIVSGDDEIYYNRNQRASHYLDLHKQIFAKYWSWKKQIYNQYSSTGCISLTDGWTLMGYNTKNTVTNFPVQGCGQVILREACRLAILSGLEIISTLHDAIYIVSDDPDKDSEMLKQVMIQAAKNVLNFELRVDVSTYDTNWDCYESEWTKEKSSAEFKKYGKYFFPPDQQ